MDLKLANVQNTSNWSSKLKLPPQDKSIFLDIETDPGHSVWMIGVLFDFQVHQFVARTREEEIIILYEFNEFLLKHLNIPIICYSGTYFDLRILLNRSKYHNIDILGGLSNRVWIDMCIELRRAFSSKSYQLKDLAKENDYPLTHDLDGRQLSFLYKDRIELQGGLDNNFIEIAKEYNSDDLMLLPFLISKFGGNVEELRIPPPIEPAQIVHWVKQNIKLMHKKPNGITLFLPKSLEKEGVKFLFNICVPPKIRRSKLHCAFTWDHFAKNVITEFLGRYDDDSD